ncbi:immunoglobulin i-set domain-containing protein [Ditylenchus destructor]|nr:immunoglobulin i-set domain-containing protein [Ditylenchus destructor]
MAALIIQSDTTSPATQLYRFPTGGGPLVGAGLLVAQQERRRQRSNRPHVAPLRWRNQQSFSCMAVLISLCCLCASTSADQTREINDSGSPIIHAAEDTSLLQRVRRQQEVRSHTKETQPSSSAQVPALSSRSGSSPQSYITFQRRVAFDRSSSHNDTSLKDDSAFVEVLHGRKSEVISFYEWDPPRQIRLKCSIELDPYYYQTDSHTSISNTSTAAEAVSPQSAITVNWRRKRRRRKALKESGSAMITDRADKVEEAEEDMPNREESAENESILVLDANDRAAFEEADYRCVARVPKPESGNVGAPEARVVLSRAVKLRHVKPPIVSIHPFSEIVGAGMPGRIRCDFPHSDRTVFDDKVSKLSSSVQWMRNGQEIENGDAFRIFTTSDRSILHITSGNTSLHAGQFQCIVTFHFPTKNTSVASPVSTIDIGHKTESVGEILAPDPINTVKVRRGFDAILECLVPHSSHVQWFHIIKDHNSDVVSRTPLVNDTAFVMHTAQFPNGGDFRCVLKHDDGLIYTYNFEVIVKERLSLHFEDDIYAQVRKHQGTMAKFICEIYPQMGEKADMVTWYKDGKLFKQFPRSKLNYVNTDAIYGVSLFLSIVEPEDEGIYECVIHNGDAERIHQTLLTVESPTNKTLSDLRVGVDHANACFHVNFRLPGSVKVEDARLSTYFLVYHKADDPSPLNSVPFNTAKCTSLSSSSELFKKGVVAVKPVGDIVRCSLTCCASGNYNFDAATEYVFRVSMVLNEEKSVITALSNAYNVISWDGYALRSLDLDLTYSEATDRLLIQWRPPEPYQVDGIVQGYILEIFNLSVSDSLSPSRKTIVNLAEKDLRYTLDRVSGGKPFIYKFRVIPLTRSGRPPLNVLDSIDRFGYTVFNWEIATPIGGLTENDNEHHGNSNSPLFTTNLPSANVPPPLINFKQISRQALIRGRWDIKSAELDEDTHMVIRFGNINNHRQLEHRIATVKIPIADGTTDLSGSNLELGLVYQVCALLETSTGLRSPWRCSNVALFDENGKLRFYREQDMMERKKLPTPVICEKGNCRCEFLESTQTMRFHWTIGKSKKQNVQKGKSKPMGAGLPAYFVLHYTFNETDPAASDFSLEYPLRRVRQSGEVERQMWVDVPPGRLLPSTHYRIMIEAQNADRDGVYGTYFDCDTPTDLGFPPPTSLTVLNIAGSTVNLSWVPLEFPSPSIDSNDEDQSDVASQADGYVLYWQPVQDQKAGDTSSIQNRFIRGIHSSLYSLTQLQSDLRYVIWMTTHTLNRSPNLSLPSTKIEINVPKLDAVQEPTPILPSMVQRWYRRTEYHVIVALLLVVLFFLCLATGCVWFHSWLSEHKRKRRKRNVLDTGGKGFELDLLRVGDCLDATSCSQSSATSSPEVDPLSSIPVAEAHHNSNNNRCITIRKKRSSAGSHIATNDLKSYGRDSAETSLIGTVESDPCSSSSLQPREWLDAKGGPSGCQPAGSRRFRQLLKENPTFRQMIQINSNTSPITEEPHRPPIIINADQQLRKTSKEKPTNVVVIEVEELSPVERAQPEERPKNEPVSDEHFESTPQEAPTESTTICPERKVKSHSLYLVRSRTAIRLGETYFRRRHSEPTALNTIVVDEIEGAKNGITATDLPLAECRQRVPHLHGPKEGIAAEAVPLQNHPDTPINTETANSSEKVLPCTSSISSGSSTASSASHQTPPHERTTRPVLECGHCHRVPVNGRPYWEANGAGIHYRPLRGGTRHSYEDIVANLYEPIPEGLLHHHPGWHPSWGSRSTQDDTLLLMYPGTTTITPLRSKPSLLNSGWEGAHDASGCSCAPPNSVVIGEEFIQEKDITHHRPRRRAAATTAALDHESCSYCDWCNNSEDGHASGQSCCECSHRVISSLPNLSDSGIVYDCCHPTVDGHLHCTPIPFAHNHFHHHPHLPQQVVGRNVGIRRISHNTPPPTLLALDRDRQHSPEAPYSRCEQPTPTAGPTYFPDVVDNLEPLVNQLPETKNIEFPSASATKSDILPVTHVVPYRMPRMETVIATPPATANSRLAATVVLNGYSINPPPTSVMDSGQPAAI